MISSPIYTICLPTFHFLYLYLFYIISLLLFGIPIFNKTLTYFTMSKLYTYIPFSCLFYILLLPFLIYTFTPFYLFLHIPFLPIYISNFSSFSYFIFHTFPSFHISLKLLCQINLTIFGKYLFHWFFQWITVIGNY
jgi:hypothetical protein